MTKNPSINSTKKRAATKYRPVLTSEQILHILNLAKLEQPSISSASISLISVLAPFQAKIENAGIQAAYTTSLKAPSTTSLEALGGTGVAEALGSELPSCITSSAIVSTEAMIGKEAYWEQCFHKYSANPTLCSLQEIEAANEYRYINDMMSTEEQEEFENEGGYK